VEVPSIAPSPKL